MALALVWVSEWAAHGWPLLHHRPNGNSDGWMMAVGKVKAMPRQVCHGRSTTVLLRRSWTDSRDVAAELQMATLQAASKAQEDEMEVPDRCLVSRCAVGAS